MSARRAIRDDLIGVKFQTNNGICTVINYVTYKEVNIIFDGTGFETTTSLSRLKDGKISDPLAKTFAGVGYIGIGEYKTIIDGKRPPYYIRWAGMISRCCAEGGRKVNPSYNDAFINEKWHNLQNYAEWYLNHPYRNDSWEIDKDILVKDNKEYSEGCCIFVPKYINTMFTKSNSMRDDLPIGVVRTPRSQYYTMICSDSIDGKVTVSGFKTPEEAFYAYKEQKERVIKKTAKLFKSQLEPRAYDALLNYKVEITD